MYELNDLKVLIKSKTPIVVVETHEEARVLRLFTQLVIEFPEHLYKWAITEGLQRIDVKDMQPQAFNLARNLSGLPQQDVRRLARHAIADDGALSKSDLPEIMTAKYRLLSKDNGLSFEHDTAKFSDVAGMKKLKKWLQQRKDVFIAEKPPKGLDRPKGLLLNGVQGSGKSLTAKAIAGVWNLPLLHLDIGSLFNKFIGETEKNLRDAIKTAEVMSPCILWIDEIEKGISTGDDTTGTSDRVLGTILTWMAERKHRVFLAITANNIEALPPELIRKGRLDEIFFVDLPDHNTRKEIFRIHLNKREVSSDSFDLERLAQISNGFSGAEIEQSVVSDLYAAHAENSPLKQAQLLEELLSTKPLSVVMAEKIASLRAWASERTVSAN